MRAIRIIAANTFREALRDKILYLFLGFSIAPPGELEGLRHPHRR